MVKRTSLHRRSNQQTRPSSAEEAMTPGRERAAMQQVRAALCPFSRRGFIFLLSFGSDDGSDFSLGLSKDGTGGQ